MTNQLDELERLLAKATAGPWAQGYNWLVAGTHPPCDPDRETCAHCNQGEPVEVVPASAEDIADGKDPRTMWHRHRNFGAWLVEDETDEDGNVIGTKPAFGIHRIEGPKGESVACNYDYEAGGIIADEDAKLIVALRNNAEKLLRVARAAQAVRKAGCCNCEDYDALLAALKAMEGGT